MEVTVNIPDQFVERLIPPGKDASRVLLEDLVDRARNNGSIDAEEADAILGRAGEAEPKGASSSEESLNDALERYLNGRVPEWMNDPEQVRLHAAADKFIGCISSSTLPQSTDVSKAMKDSLMERYERSRRGR